MSFIQSIIYGFVSGLTEFLPVSSGGHETLLRELFGISQGAPVLDVLIHIAIILAIIYNCRAYLRRLLLVSRSTAKTRALRNDRSNIYENKVIVATQYIHQRLIIVRQNDKGISQGVITYM